MAEKKKIKLSNSEPVISKFKFNHLILIIVAVGIIARFLYYFSEKHSPLFLYTIIDEKEFVNNAWVLVKDHFNYPWYYWHPPAYSYFLAFLFYAGFKLKSVVLIQYLMGISGTVFLYLGLKKINQRAAFIAALIWAVYPAELFTETKFLSENLFTFAVFILFCIIMNFRQNILYFILAGILTSIIIITKTQFIIFFIFFILVCVFVFKTSFRNILLYTIFSMCLPFLTSIHNTRATGGHFIFVSTNGPVNLYIGNSENINKTLNIRPYEWRESFFPKLYDERGLRFEKSSTDSGETFPYKLSSFLAEKTLKANKNPLVLLKNTGLKSFITLHSYETPRNYDIYQYRQINNYLKYTLFSKPFCFPLALFYYASLIFIFIHFKKIIRERQKLMILLLAASCLLPSVIFFNAFRYRLTGVAFLLFFAVMFYSENYKNLKLQLVNFILIIIFATGLLKSLLIQKIPLFETYVFYGDGYLKKNQYAKAGFWYEKAIGSINDDPGVMLDKYQVMMNLAMTRENEENYPEAIKYYSLAHEYKKDEYKSFYREALLRYKVSDFKGAAKNYTEALSIQDIPRDDLIQLFYGRGLSRAKLRDAKGALADFNSTIEMNSIFSKVYSDRGIIRAGTNDLAGALADFNTAIRLSPDDYNSWFNRAVTKGNSGDFNGAMQDLNQTIQLKPDFADAFYMRGLIKLQSGQKQEACIDLKESLKLGNKNAEQQIMTICH